MQNVLQKRFYHWELLHCLPRSLMMEQLEELISVTARLNRILVSKHDILNEEINGATRFVFKPFFNYDGNYKKEIEEYFNYVDYFSMIFQKRKYNEIYPELFLSLKELINELTNIYKGLTGKHFPVIDNLYSDIMTEKYLMQDIARLDILYDSGQLTESEYKIIQNFLHYRKFKEPIFKFTEEQQKNISNELLTLLSIQEIQGEGSLAQYTYDGMFYVLKNLYLPLTELWKTDEDNSRDEIIGFKLNHKNYFIDTENDIDNLE